MRILTMGVEELLHDPVTITSIKIFTLRPMVDTARCAAGNATVCLVTELDTPLRIT